MIDTLENPQIFYPGTIKGVGISFDPHQGLVSRHRHAVALTAQMVSGLCWHNSWI